MIVLTIIVVSVSLGVAMIFLFTFTPVFYSLTSIMNSSDVSGQTRTQLNRATLMTEYAWPLTFTILLLGIIAYGYFRATKRESESYVYAG